MAPMPFRHKFSTQLAPGLADRPPKIFSAFKFTVPHATPVDIDNDNDHGSNICALSCREGQSAWALAQSLFGERFASCREDLSWYTCASLVPLGNE